MTHALELTDRSRRVDRFRWDVLDATLTGIGSLNPVAGAPMQATTEGNVNRTVRGLEIAPGDVADLDPARDRLRPVYTDLEGTDWPLGVYRVASAETKDHAASGTLPTFDLADDSLRFATNTYRRQTWPRGYPVADALEEWALSLDVADFEIDPTLDELPEPMAFPVGRSTFGEVGEALCAAAGMLPPHFDNAGTLRCRIAPVWDVVAVDHDHRLDGGVIVWGSYSTATSYLDTPNVWIAVNDRPGQQPIRGRWALPESAPNSIAALGYEMPEYVTGNFASTAAAVAAARAAGQNAYDQLGEASLSTPLDPRHDLYSVIAVDGARYRVVGWRTSLRAGQPMTFDLRRVWADL